MKNLLLLTAAIGLIVIAIITIFMITQDDASNETQNTQSNNLQELSEQPINDIPEVSETTMKEENRDNINCREDISLETPVDLSLATSILYPGQYRGNDYKPHGGFRFDNSKTTDITVRAPMKSYVTSGSRYLESEEVQYLFEFEDDCNVTYRFDHLRTLSPKLAEIAESFPGPVEGDSRTTFVDRIQIEELEILATEVGVPGNVFVDFGVYDYRQPNEISYDPEWLAQDDTNEPQAMHAVCWFDLLPQEDASIVKSLPGSGIEGSTSDYC